MREESKGKWPGWVGRGGWWVRGGERHRELGVGGEGRG